MKDTSTSVSVDENFLLFCGDEVKELVTPSYVDRESPSFLSEYFRKNQSKPKVRVYVCRKRDSEDMASDPNDDLCSWVVPSIGKTTFEPEQAAGFIWYMMGKISGRLTEEWIAHGLKIGKQEEVITPRDILEPLETIIDVPLATNRFSEDDKWGAFWSLVGGHRLMKLNGSYEDYIERQRRNVGDKLRERPFLAKKGVDVASFHNSLFEKVEYTALVAAIDMFLFRFKDHEMRRGRIGTMSTRGLGDVALSSLIGIKEACGMELGEIFSYLPMKALVAELSRLGKDEGQTDPYSYFPYIKSMGICSASPYSASMNPMVFTTVHVLGTILGVERSINAIKVTDNCKGQIINMAAVAAYYISNSQSYQIIAAKNREKHALYRKHMEEFFPDKLDEESGIKIVEPLIVAGERYTEPDMPLTEYQDARDAVNLLNTMDQLPRNYARKIYNSLASRKLRPSSIGQMVKEALSSEQ